MRLKILGSSSKGNSYILENDNTALLVECGVSHKEIGDAINFEWSKVCGVLVSHEHKDHCKYISQVQEKGVKAYTGYETGKALFKSAPIRVLAPQKSYQIGEFKVMPFQLKHDVFCMGFLIYHPECGNVLFATDTYYIPYKFEHLHNLIIECNYSDEILNKNLLDGSINARVRDRIITSHMSLETVKNTLMANDLSELRNIVLIHLSDSNSNAKQFKQEIEAITGKSVTIGEKGIQISLDKTPF